MYAAHCIALILWSVFSSNASVVAPKATIPAPIFADQSSVVKIIGQSWAHVAVTSKSNVWAVHINKRIYFYNGTSLKSVNGTMEMISSGTDGSVWGLGGSSSEGGWEVYRRKGRSMERPEGDSWEKQPSSLRLTSLSVIKDNNVWGVKNFQTIMHWNGSQWQEVAQQKGVTIGEVFTGMPGIVVGLEKAELKDIRKNKRLFVRDGITADDPVGKAWKLLQTKSVTTVALNDFTTVWAVAVEGTVSRLSHWAGKEWRKFADNIQAVSVGADGAVWAIAQDDSVFRSKELFLPASGSLLNLVSENIDSVETESIKPVANVGIAATIPVTHNSPTLPSLPLQAMPDTASVNEVKRPAHQPGVAHEAGSGNPQVGHSALPAHLHRPENKTFMPGPQFIGQPVMPSVTPTPQGTPPLQPLPQIQPVPQPQAPLSQMQPVPQQPQQPLPQMQPIQPMQPLQ